ncbi:MULTISPECIES: aminodeoxychorismate/anthranilate synthase component II [unclassified Chelatococcus]|uniref:anthranilate synthase component II n=1 Tax=unclassified Chelatococcus TaxID=2638111 RepID=UPI001BCD63BF|nr:MULTISPECIES: aminodeoxychorismate/anthranilate synthase component II [unclassified Chelatococcus]MBS7697991.1 aminodeoxychorismate/anthranilate synthase component II [Chelatococcus sp. YT9]MBX3556691.1 aminodeoxychorismate/anthranilate synthase component II [Chelatococcus sp.]
MIVVIDNYDSFVFNVARYLQELGAQTRVVRNDAISVRGVLALAPQAVVISPGPCTPAEAGISLELVRELNGHVPILGICLGHQCIGAALGGQVTRARHPMHGRACDILHDRRGLFAGLPTPFRAGRYHSLVVELDEPGPLLVNARSPEGEIMAVAHRTAPTYGIQFHPESILTPHGHAILRNFLGLAQRTHENRSH